MIVNLQKIGGADKSNCTIKQLILQWVDDKHARYGGEKVKPAAYCK